MLSPRLCLVCRTFADQCNAAELDGRPLVASNWDAGVVTIKLPSADINELQTKGFNVTAHQGQLVIRSDQGLTSSPFEVAVQPT